MNFEVGKKYRTKNGSMVLYMRRDSYGDHVFRIMSGGHGMSEFFGSREGGHYTVCDNGMLYAEKYCAKTSPFEILTGTALTGMRIVGELVNDDPSAQIEEEEQMQRFCDRLGKVIAKKLLEMLKE